MHILSFFIHEGCSVVVSASKDISVNIILFVFVQLGFSFSNVWCLERFKSFYCISFSKELQTIAQLGILNK